MTADRRRILLECRDCEATLLAPTGRIQEAARWAEENHMWLTVGSGQQVFVCPKHELPCTRCLRPAPAIVEIAARSRLRPWRKASERSA